MLKPNSILDLQKLCIGAASVYSAPLFFSEKRTVWMYIFSFIHGIKWCDFIEFFFFEVDQTNFKVLKFTPGLDGSGPPVAELVVMNLCIYLNLAG